MQPKWFTWASGLSSKENKHCVKTASLSVSLLSLIFTVFSESGVNQIHTGLHREREETLQTLQGGAGVLVTSTLTLHKAGSGCGWQCLAQCRHWRCVTASSLGPQFTTLTSQEELPYIFQRTEHKQPIWVKASLSCNLEMTLLNKISIARLYQ